MPFSFILKNANSIFGALRMGERFTANWGGGSLLSRCVLGAPFELGRVALSVPCSRNACRVEHRHMLCVRQVVGRPVQVLRRGRLSLPVGGGRWSFVGLAGQSQMFKLGFHPVGLVA